MIKYIYVYIFSQATKIVNGKEKRNKLPKTWRLHALVTAGNGGRGAGSRRLPRPVAHARRQFVSCSRGII